MINISALFLKKKNIQKKILAYINLSRDLHAEVKLNRGIKRYHLLAPFLFANNLHKLYSSILLRKLKKLEIMDSN